MSENQDNSTSLQPVPVRKPRGRRILRSDTLTKKDKKRLEKRNKDLQRLAIIEDEVQQLIAIKAQNSGTLRGTGARNTAAHLLGVCVETIDSYIKAYEKNPSLDAFIGAESGRPPGQGFTEDQEAVISLLYLATKIQTIFLKTLEITSTPYRPTASYIHEVLELVLPDPPKSVHQVRRYLERLKKDDPAVHILVQRGEKYFREKILPKPRNDVDNPHDRWQLDGRPLPSYIKHDGNICTVSLLLNMDDHASFALRARLIPRILNDEQGIPKRAEFNKADVGILIASTMYHYNIYPGTLYTDHGSQIVVVGELLKDLLRDGEMLTNFTRSIPGRPQGRGKIEQLLQQFDELLMRLPACTIPRKGESVFAAIQRAKADPEMFTLEQLQARVDLFIDELNKRPRTRRERKTRRELWERVGANGTPPIRDLMLLVPEREERDVSITNWTYQFRSHEHEDTYEPVLKSKEDMFRWMVAVSRGEFVPLRAAKLDTGWKNEICLDRDDGYWCEGILKRQQRIAADVRAEWTNSAIKRIKERLAQELAKTMPASDRLGLNNVYQDQITGEPVRVDDTTLPAPSTTADPSEGANAHNPDMKNTSVRTAPPRKAEPEKHKFNPADIPDIDELMRQAEEGLRN